MSVDSEINAHVTPGHGELPATHRPTIPCWPCLPKASVIVAVDNTLASAQARQPDLLTEPRPHAFMEQNPTWTPGHSIHSPSSTKSLISSPPLPLNNSSLLADPPFWVHHFLPWLPPPLDQKFQKDMDAVSL